MCIPGNWSPKLSELIVCVTLNCSKVKNIRSKRVNVPTAPFWGCIALCGAIWKWPPRARHVFLNIYMQIPCLHLTWKLRIRSVKCMFVPEALLSSRCPYIWQPPSVANWSFIFSLKASAAHWAIPWGLKLQPERK